MSASRYKDRWETEQEETEMEERRLHEESMCNPITCIDCITEKEMADES